MQPKTIFVCGNVLKCTNSIAADGLNDVQLKAIRTWPKTCGDCTKSTQWIEQLALFDNIEQKPNTQRIGGRRNANNRNNGNGSH